MMKKRNSFLNELIQFLVCGMIYILPCTGIAAVLFWWACDTRQLFWVGFLIYTAAYLINDWRDWIV